MSDLNVIFRALTKEERINKKMFHSLKKILEAEKTKLNNELIRYDITDDELEMISLRSLTKEERLNKPMFRALEEPNELRRYEITSVELESMFPYLLLALDSPGIAVSELGSSDQGTSRLVSSNSEMKAKPCAKHALLTTRYEDEKPKCPLCAKVFKGRYEQHKQRREENQCCICWQTFNSEMELVDHLEKFASNKLCCSCDHFKTLIKNKAKNFETDEQFEKHIKICFNNKKTIMKRRNSKN